MSDSYFPGMSEAEISALTDEQINKAINLACAEQGIPLFIELGDAPTPSVAMDREVFVVGGWEFLDRAHADDVAAVAASYARVKARWGRNYNFEPTYEEDAKEIEVATKRYFSPQQYLKCQIEIETAAARKTEYDARKAAWESASEKRGHVSRQVWKEINAAMGKIRERQRIIDLHAKYVELADGNRETAWKFLQAAEKLDDRYGAELGFCEAPAMEAAA